MMMIKRAVAAVVLPWNPIPVTRRFCSSTQLFVSRLSFYTTDEQLRKLFSPFGHVTEARLVKDPKTQRPKGFGFVTYAHQAHALKAIKAMDGRIVGGRLIFVETAKITEPAQHDITS